MFTFQQLDYPYPTIGERTTNPTGSLLWLPIKYHICANNLLSPFQHCSGNCNLIAPPLWKQSTPCASSRSMEASLIGHKFNVPMVY